MIYKELYDFVKAETEKGHSRDVLEPLLLQHGWSRLDIFEVYRSLAFAHQESIKKTEVLEMAITQPAVQAPQTATTPLRLPKKRWLLSLGVSLLIVLSITFANALATGYFERYPNMLISKLLR